MDVKGIMLNEKNLIPKDYILHPSICIHFWNDKILEKETRLVVAWGLGWGDGQEGSGRGYKKATWGIFVVMELFCILTVVVDTKPTHGVKWYRTEYTRKYKTLN